MTRHGMPYPVSWLTALLPRLLACGAPRDQVSYIGQLHGDFICPVLINAP